MQTASKKNRYLYNKNLRPLSKALRQNMTKAEACLWKFVLRASTLRGYTFYRQRSIKSYIVDFFCKKLRLIIEVDGLTHNFDETQHKDKMKEQELTEAGFMVIRFRDDEVLNNIDGVKQTLEYHVELREKELRLPPPVRLRRTSPSMRGT